MTETHIAGELHGLSAHPGDIYHRAAMTVEALMRERDEAREAALEEAAKVALAHITYPDVSDNPASVRFEPAEMMAKKIACGIRALKEPAVSLRKPVFTKPHCPNLEGREHD
jgi:hypothetical protein